jgi:hypothetical protein
VFQDREHVDRRIVVKRDATERGDKMRVAWRASVLRVEPVKRRRQAHGVIGGVNCDRFHIYSAPSFQIRL